MGETQTRSAQPRADALPSRRPVRMWWLSLALLSAPLLLFLCLPLVALVLRIDLLSVLMRLGEPPVVQAISLSLLTASLATLIALFAGTPVAYLLARWSFRGRGVLDTLIDLPMVLPPSVAGIALLITFGRRGLVGQYLAEWGVSLAFTSAAVVLAQTFVAAPFYVKAAMGAFARVERELEQAAAIDGASPLQVFRLVTVPLSRTMLLGGLVMTWARALGEFGATIIFAGNLPGRTQTMPLAIYLGFELDLGVALTLSVILLATSFAVLFVVKRILAQSVPSGSL